MPHAVLLLRNAGFDRRLTRLILPLAGAEHLTEDHFIHFRSLHAGALQNPFDGRSADFHEAALVITIEPEAYC